MYTCRKVSTCVLYYKGAQVLAATEEVKKMREELYKKVADALPAPYWGSWRSMRDLEARRAVELLECPWVQVTNVGIEIRRRGYTEVIPY